MPKEDNLVFGDKFSFDLIFLDGNAVQHIMEIVTQFSAVTFLESKGESYGHIVEGIWSAFSQIW